jgi:hypothetical protein
MKPPRVWAVLALVWLVAACDKEGPQTVAQPPKAKLPVDQLDAETLGREVLELVDRAVDYRGSHRGRPAASLRQMGVDSLTPTTARHVLNVNREPVVTVQFRKDEGHVITSCRGDSHILEEASINAGRFTMMCTSRSGVQRPVQVSGLGR